MLKYLFPFLTSFLLTVVLMFIIIGISKKFQFFSRKSERHIHPAGISRIGGLAMAVAFVAAVFFNNDLVITLELYGFLIGAVALLIMGMVDDVKEIFWKVQLFVQIAVAVFIFIMGVKIYYITNPLTGGVIQLSSGLPVIFSAVLVITWIVLVMNSINWSDGIDGLSGGISLITAATIFFLSFRPEVNQPPIAIISIILIGTIIGFLVFNFYPSRILAGTSGATFMGFSLAVLAIFSGAKIATSLLVLAIPIIDAIWVIIERLKNRQSIFKPDKNHLHYKLMELGWSQKKIMLVYLAITTIIAFISLNTHAIGKGITLALTFVFMLFILIFINRRVYSLKKTPAKE